MPEYQSFADFLKQQTPEQILQSAKEHNSRGDFAKASKWLRELLRREPSNGEAHYWLGASLIQRQRFAEAIACLQSATSNGFDHPEVHLRRGEALLGLSERSGELAAFRGARRDEACQAFAKAIDLAASVAFSDGSLVDARIAAARAETAANRPDKALEYLQATIRHDPAALPKIDSTFYALLQQRSDRDEILARLCAAVHGSGLPIAYTGLVKLLGSLSRASEAFEEFIRGLACYVWHKGQPSGFLQYHISEFAYNVKSDGFSEREPAIVNLQRLLRELDYANYGTLPPLVCAGYAWGLLKIGLMDAGQAAMQMQELLKSGEIDADVLAFAADLAIEMEAEWRRKYLASVTAAIDRAGQSLWHSWGLRLLLMGETKAAEDAFDVALNKLARAFEVAENNGDPLAWVAENIDRLCSILQQIGSDTTERAQGKSAAIHWIDRAILPTSSASTLRTWAATLGYANRPKEAMERFRQALESSDDADASWHFDALREAITNNPDVRDALLTSVFKHQHRSALSQLVQMLIEQKLWEQAERFANIWRARVPESDAPLSSLGKIYSAQRRWDKAVLAYESAVERIPADERIYTALLDGIRELENSAGAVGQLVAVVKDWRDGKETRVNWQQVERLRDDVVWRLQRLIHAVQESCDDIYLAEAVAIGLLDQGMPGRATGLFEKFAELFPDDLYATYHYHWGLALSRQGNDRAAIGHFRSAARENPDFVVAHQLRAESHFLLDRPGTAGRAYAAGFSQATTDIGSGEVVEAYVNWAGGLVDIDLYEEAMAKVDDASRLKPNDYWVLFEKAYVLHSMSAYDEAWTGYAHAIQHDPSLPHAHHNLCDILEEQGLFGEARNKLNETLVVYANALIGNLTRRDFFLLKFYAEKCLAAKQEARAEDLLRMGLLLAPNDPIYDIVLAKRYFRQQPDGRLPPTLSGADTLPRAARTPPRFKALNHFRRAEAALRRRLARARTSATLLDCADLYMAADEFDKALACFEEAARRQLGSMRALKGLGECLIRLDRPRDAVRSLEAAVKLRPELEVHLLLAQAHRRADKLDEAEAAYQSVLRIAPHYVDARVGLGELYLDMAEKRAAQKDSSGLAELYSRAIVELTLAVSYFDSPDAPFTIASHKTSALYLLGYAQVLLYQSSLIRRDRSLMSNARRNFRAANDGQMSATHEPHLKAQRALDAIVDERRGLRSLAERHGGNVVVGMALLLFALAQFGVIQGRPTHQQKLIFNAQSAEALAVLGDLPKDLAAKFKSVESRTFRTGEAVADWLKNTLGAEPYAKFGRQLAGTAKPGAVELEWQDLDLTSYLTLTFGSLLLMIAGAYLPQLTSLKLAGVQLEKASAERVETRTTIAISR